MTSSRSFPTRQLLVLLIVTGCLFFAGLGRLPLLEPDEGRNAEVAREMLASRDWITPHFDALAYLDKPVVFFWLVATSFRLWGVSEWAARFPSALMALAATLLTWALGRRMFAGPTGFRAALIFASSPLVLGLSHLVTFDMTLTFFIGLAMLCYWWSESGPSRPAWQSAAVFAAMGLGTITKGPVGFLVPLLSIVTYHALRGSLRDLKGMRWGLGVAVFLAVVLPWFIVVSVRHPDFPRYALWQESLQRFATRATRRSGSIAYYVPVYLAGFFPWSFFLLFATWNRLRQWRKLGDHQPAEFLLAWAGVVFVFFSISQSKLPAYFLPALVPLSVLMARVWQEVESSMGKNSPDWLTAGFAVLLALGLLIAFASHLPILGALEGRIARKIHPSVLATLKPSLLYAGLILVAVAMVGRNLTRGARGRRAVLTFTLLALTTPLLVLRCLVPLRTYVATNSSRGLARAILLSPERELPVYGYYYFRTSLPFYLRRPVGLVTRDGGETTSRYIAEHFSVLRVSALPSDELAGHSNSQEPDKGRAGVLKAQPDAVLIDVAALASIQHPALIMARNSHVSDLTKLFVPIEPLWSGWDYSVWKVTGNR